jgi:hypothetical protein
MFGIPEGAPRDVEAAWERFDAVVVKYEEARGALAAAERNVPGAKARDRDAAAQAVIAGKDAPSARNEQKALTEVERLERLVSASEHAVDLVGDELARTVADHQQGWRTAAAEDAENAQAAYLEALDTLRTQAEKLAAARGALSWLGSVAVNPDHPTIGHAVIEANAPNSDALRLSPRAERDLRMGVVFGGLELIAVLEELA